MPDFMHVRYEHWVNGLTGDWLISRQRFFGVAIPVWYPVGAEGSVEYDHPILPDEGHCPSIPLRPPPPATTRASEANREVS